MKKRLIIALLLLISLSTITLKPGKIISKFNINNIIIENNFLLSEKDIKKLLSPIYEKNLLLLSNKEIEKIMIQNNLVESFKIKKKYPNTLKIQIFEKKPIAILFYKKKKFFVSEKLELFDFSELPNNSNLPYVFGSKENFKELYYNLNKINFPLGLIKKYTFYKTYRWDIETINSKVIKLPPKNYTKNLENYLLLKNKKEFKNYNIFDYRIKNQLILK